MRAAYFFSKPAGFVSRLNWSGLAVFVLGFVLLFAVAAPTAKAGTTYTYTGNAYTTCAGTYATDGSCGPYALSVVFTTTLTGSALVSLPLTTITSTVTSFTFTDGSGLTVNSSNASYKDFEIATDASGNLVGWFVTVCGTTCNTQMQTNWNTPELSFSPGEDFSETTASFAGSYGYVYDNPGTWTSQTGQPINPNNPANLSQQFVFNNTAGQHVEQDIDYTTAFNTNNDLTVVADTVPSISSQGITQATYSQMVAGTSLATTDCFTAPGEGTDSSGNPLCAQLTLTCTNASSSTPAGDNCPQSTQRNLYIAQLLSTPGASISIPSNTAPTLAMGSDTWSPANCTLTGPEAGLLCPQSELTQFELWSTDPAPKPGGTTKTTNSAFVAGCCEPEWNTVAQIPAWWNSTTVPVSFTANLPTAPPSPNNNWVAAPNLSITWGWENLGAGATLDTTYPVPGDQTAANTTPCPSTWATAVAAPFTTPPSQTVTVPGEGAFEVHFFSTACDNQEELVFPSSVGSGTTLNVNQAAFKTAPFSVDLTKPVVSSITLNPPPSGGYYAQNSSVTASFTCTDPVSNGVASGVATCGPGSTNYAGQNPVVVSGAPVPTGTPGTQTFTAIATDVAGNASAPSSVNYTVVGPANVNVGMAGNLLVKSGQNITYLVGIANLGPNTADLVNLVGTVPAGTTFVNSGYALESCTVVNNMPVCTLSPPTNSCGSGAGSCSVGTLPVWGSKNLIGVLVQITVNVTALPGATIKNTVSVGAANTNLAPNTTASWLTKVVK